MLLVKEGPIIALGKRHQQYGVAEEESESKLKFKYMQLLHIRGRLDEQISYDTYEREGGTERYHMVLMRGKGGDGHLNTKYYKQIWGGCHLYILQNN